MSFPISFLLSVSAILLLHVDVQAATPQEVPWPIGYSEAEMHYSRSLAKDYGDFNGNWSGNEYGFHTGIDVSEFSAGGCTEVRCVRAGYVTEVDSVQIDGTSNYEWFMVICDEPRSPIGTADFGWCYQHVDRPLYVVDQPVPYGAVIGVMDPDTPVRHLHFAWTDWDYAPCISYANPEFFLDPAPVEEEGFSWLWNPSSYSPSYESFFLPQMSYQDWGDLSVEEAVALMLDENELQGDVDMFLGLSLAGCGMLGPITDWWQVPQRISWEVIREKPSGEEVISSRYVMDFDEDCLLESPSYNDPRTRMLYFSHLMNEVFSGHYGVLCCLTNSGDYQGWAGLGIDNIQENSWSTDSDCLLEGDDTSNPVLAAFRDGPYRIDIDSYPFDLDESFTASVDVVLRNFDPVVLAVEIEGSGGIAWSAHWEAVEVVDGLEVEFVIEEDEPVEPGQTLTATVVFSEPMNTASGSYSITAGKAPDYNDLGVTTTGWSCTNNPSPYYDTWNGTIEVPSSGYSGRINLRIEAEDTDGNCLKDPADAFPSDDEYSDLYHGFGIAFGPEAGWDGELEHQVESSPVLADMDGDGDLDVGIVDCDGWVHLLDDDGTSLSVNWPASGWSYFPQPIRVTPAIVDLDGDGDMDVISTHSCGGIARDIATGANLPGWPVFLGVQGPDSLLGLSPSCASPVVGDADGDGLPEVVISRVFTNTSVNLESTVFMFDHTGGTCKWACNLEPSLDGASVYATPAMCDVNGDDDIDVLVVTAEGYQIYLNGADSTDLWNESGVYLLNGSTGAILWETSVSNCHIYGAPVVADLEGDGTNEVIFGTAITSGGTTYRKVHILSGETGSIEHSLPVPDWVMGPVGVGDLDDDGYLDIVAEVNGGSIYAWSGAGSHALLPGFPVSVTGNTTGSPTIVDMDADFELEIVAGTRDGLLYAINADGSICTGFPVNTGSGIPGQVAAGDIDGDGALELVGADDGSAQAWCYDMGSGSYPCEMPWRQFQHDSWHSGCFEADNTVPAAPTGLAASVTYMAFGYTADLTWELSVNDVYSPDPEDPADVTDYRVYRAFPPFWGYSLVGHTHAGDGSYTDMCSSPLGPIAKYVVTALDGTNESDYSDYIKFKTVPGMNLAEGCRVEVELERGSTVVSEAVTSERIDAAPVGRTTETAVSPVIDAAAVAMRSDPGLLTDGELDEEYIPGAGVRAVVLDLGSPCRVDHVEVVGAGADGTAAIDAGAGCSVEYSVDGEDWQPASVRGTDTSVSAVRYVRLVPAPVASEIQVWGVRTEEDLTEAEIGLERSDTGWTLAVPELGESSRGEAGTLSVYDLAGRLVRSWGVRAGDAVEWDGATGLGVEAVPGCYFVRYEQGGRAVTRRLVIIEEQ
ncbi:MAG: hypothetical protein GX465_18725 [Acidobacteria bacterium]|nr:hypothetical protein [Acidobacteriota bacterium]